MPLDLTALAALGEDVDDGDTYVIRRDGTTYKVSHAELVGGLISSLISGKTFFPGKAKTIYAGATEVDDLIDQGIYTYSGTTPSGGPTSGAVIILHLTFRHDRMVQLAFAPISNAFYLRSMYDSVWGGWDRIN